jgi:hypothetical protein
MPTHGRNPTEPGTLEGVEQTRIEFREDAPGTGEA